MIISDFLELLKIKAKTYSIAGGILILGALASFYPEKSAWQEVKKTIPEINTKSLSEAAGTGIVLGTIGGFRTIFADIIWLRGFHFWTKTDIGNCLTLINLARILDPQQFFFWEQSLNFIAYDFPHWDIAKRGGPKIVSSAVQREIHKRYYQKAMELEKKCEETFPEKSRVYQLAAQIVLLKTYSIYNKGDFETCANYYKKASKCNDAHWYTFAAYVRIIRSHLPKRIEEAKEYIAKSIPRRPDLKDLFDKLNFELEHPELTED